MSKKELAFECNIPLVTYEEWENGTVKPPIYIIKLLAKALGIELKDKLQLIEDPDIAWREGDSVFRCAIATINPTVKIKILEEITFNNPLIQ